MTPYAQLIANTIGTSDGATLKLVEELMRCDRPTLDALTRPQFRRLAREGMAAARELARTGELAGFCAALAIAVPTLTSWPPA
jgi:hypothetical protein